MDESYTRAQQNEASLHLLSQKVSALRNVTSDIYERAQDQGVLDTSAEIFTSMGDSMRGSGQRLGRAVRRGDAGGVLKLAGIVVVVVVGAYWVGRWLFW